ncbi:MAG: tetratricopeptide repeat protein [Caulobacteraceae bacterium]
MCRKPPPTATALATLISALALAAPASAWPFAAKPAPATPPPAAQPAPSAPAADTGPRKATPQERAAAARLDPLAKSAFWAREADFDPTDAEAGLELAVSLRALGRFQEASDAVGRILVIYPTNLEALLEAARDQVGQGKGFYALDPLRKAEAAAPRDWRAYSLMAVAREQNRQPDEARAAYDQALALSPDNPAVLSNLGLWYASHGKPAEGETYLRRAAAQPTATAQERQNLALVLGMEGKLGEAEHLMRDDLPPDVADANLAYLRAVSKGAAPNPLTSGQPGGPGPVAQAR